MFFFTSAKSRKNKLEFGRIISEDAVGGGELMIKNRDLLVTHQCLV